MHWFLSGSILKELSVNLIAWKLNVANDRTSDETIFHRQLQSAIKINKVSKYFYDGKILLIVS